ncbi:FCGBP protein, partial [Centropus unirufus]|nr:FCGBP protein [Centropus unirufus]
CKVGEKCVVDNGVRRCVAKSHSTCVATGDPHYTTFDGHRYDFMGTCIYQLAALCSDDPTLVPFSVTVENNNRGSHVVSYTKVVTLEVYNMTLSLSQEHPQKLKVNGILVDLPFTHGPKLQAYLSGVHGFIRTDFGLTVTFDWYSYARVLLPNTYAGAVCGLCGNANGDPKDDYRLPDGQLATDEVQFGGSWKVAEVPGCRHECTEACKVCTEVEKRSYRGDKHCGLLVKKQGPLAACHRVIDPTPYFNDCLFDTCLYKGHQETACRSISAYVTECQRQGVRIGRWRTAAFCSTWCGERGSPWGWDRTFKERLGCDALVDTCNEVPTTCAEGCYCDDGFLLSGDRCVPLAQCGCIHEGRYYKKGEEFISCPRCSERCVCQGDGVVECRPEACAAGEVCMVQDGVQGCFPDACGRCQVLGATTYQTFDGQMLAFTGDCTFPLATVEADGPEDLLVPFVVELEKESGKEGPLIRRVVVTVHGVTISMDRGTHWEVKVDGERHLLPLELAGGAVTVTQEGTHRVLRAQGGPKLLYDGATFVLLTLPSSFQHRPRGLCGNFNGDAGDDLNQPQELETTHAHPCTHGSLPTACPLENGRCGILADPSGPFAGCHGVVAPQDYVAGCLQEQCGTEDLRALCRSLQGYAAACQAAGGTLQEWREVAQCPLQCPPHSHYELCGQSCTRTCTSISSGARCASRCFEGCQCDDGFLFDGAQCHPAGACGCLHRGRYFQIAESFLSSDCSQRCMCRAAGGIHCHPATCPLGQACGLQDGVRACVEQPGRCTLVPSSRFVSFDGATGTTVTTGVYVVATVCDSNHPSWFRLLADVGEDQDLPVVEALHFYSSRGFITIKRDKKVWVNGVPTAFPVEISSTLAINETRGTISVTQAPELEVNLSPAGEVTAMVAKGLTKKLCGICGNYDGDATNDLQGPDGKRVVDAGAVAKAWRAPDFTHVS